MKIKATDKLKDYRASVIASLYELELAVVKELKVHEAEIEPAIANRLIEAGLALEIKEVKKTKIDKEVQ